MRNFVVVPMILALVFSRAEAQKIPTGVFSSLEACEASKDNYSPAFLSGHKSLGEGESIVTLTQRQCGEMVIAGGRYAIVAQAAGTEMVAKNGTIVRRWDCGNGARGFVIPTPPPLPVPTPAAAVPQSPDTIVHVLTGRVGIDITVRDSTERRPIQMPVARTKKGFPWKPVGLVAGAVALAAGGYFLLRPDSHKAFVATLPPSP